MKGKHRRLLEWGKTLLILLLSASAIYLASLTFFPGGAASFLSRLPQQSGASQTQRAFLPQTLRPAAFAVTLSDGRYAQLYHQDDQETYTRVSSLLAEALSEAGAPQPISQAEWRQVLRGPSLFCEYLGAMPLDTLARWLSDQDNAALEGQYADRLCVTPGALCFCGDRGPYSCALSSDLTQALEELSAPLSPNGARFAFEDQRYDPLRPDSLVLDDTPALPLLNAEAAFTVSDGAAGDTLSSILQALSFHPQTNPLYAITGGWAVTDGGDTLRIRDNGQISFHQSEETSPHFPVEGSYLDLSRTLAEQTVGTSAGDARLYLQEVSQEDGAVTVTYGYAYLGAVIRTGDSGWAARFTVSDGAVTSFTLCPRRYVLSADPGAVLLPQEQASAALPGPNGRTLRPLYEDGGPSLMVPFWATVR